MIIKAAWGGKSLAVDFRPPSAVAARGGEVGPFYQAIFDYTREMQRFHPPTTAPIGTAMARPIS